MHTVCYKCLVLSRYSWICWLEQLFPSPFSLFKYKAQLIDLRITIYNVLVLLRRDLYTTVYTTQICTYK